MNAGDWFLVFALLTATGTLLASIKIRDPHSLLIIPVFILSLLLTELTAYMAILQLVISLVFISNDALDSGNGTWAMLIMAANWLAMYRLNKLSHQANSSLQRALEASLGTDYLSIIPVERRALIRRHVDRKDLKKPFSYAREGVDHLTDIAYGDAGKRNLLDIYRPTQPREGGYPVLLQVHGGGWMIGNKQEQAQPLMHYLAQRGWLCVSINYRLSPADKFPAHIIDVKKAIAWIREHITEYGGNADFLAITGGSAGGHLTALAALSANDPAYQPGFEDANTAVDVAIPYYGVYDFIDHTGLGANSSLRGMLKEKVFDASPAEDPDLWRQGSPICRIHAAAPPFFVIHGSHDVMTSPEETRVFVDRLRSVSDQPVVHAELPGAEHAFDVPHSIRTSYATNHVSTFLEWAYARKQAE
jgi:acetyl esterase/lipase